MPMAGAVTEVVRAIFMREVKEWMVGSRFEEQDMRELYGTSPYSSDRGHSRARRLRVSPHRLIPSGMPAETRAVTLPQHVSVCRAKEASLHCSMI